VRALVREARLAREDLILPLFACPGEGVRREVPSMPGVFNLSVDEIAREAAAAFDVGVPAVILFGLPESKDETATGAYAARGVVQQAIRAVRRAAPEMIVIADTCLCEYTSHGHCGVVREGEVLNDESLELLARTAVSQAEAGADIVAPSAMMDGQVGAIREALDEDGFEHVAIMSYAVKYASAFYGPFREAADSAPAFGDRSSAAEPPQEAIETAVDQLATAFRAAGRQSDAIGRVGPTEFAVVAFGTDAAGIGAMLEKQRTVINDDWKTLFLPVLNVSYSTLRTSQPSYGYAIFADPCTAVVPPMTAFASRVESTPSVRTRSRQGLSALVSTSSTFVPSRTSAPCFIAFFRSKWSNVSRSTS